MNKFTQQPNKPINKPTKEAATSAADNNPELGPRKAIWRGYRSVSV